MRLLLVTHYWRPEYGPDPPILHETALGLAGLGVCVDVLAAMPSYPSGIVAPPYRWRLLSDEDVDGVRTVRSWTLSAPRRHLAGRIANELSFDLTCLLARLKLRGRYDFVLAVTPPLTLIPSAWVLSRSLGARLALWVMDLHPEAAVASGLIRQRHAVALLGRMAGFGYRKATLILAPSEHCRDGILRRHADPTKVHVVHNGIDTERFRPLPRPAPDAKQGLLAIYAGSMSHAHDLDSILSVAQSMQSQGDHGWRFLLVGSGVRKAPLQQQLQSRGLRNVELRDPVPGDQLPALLATADAVLVTFRDIETNRGVIPTKLFDAMASGRPAILGIRGEARGILDRARAGIGIDPESPAALRDALRRLQRDPSLRLRLGDNARRYAVDHFNRTQLVNQIHHHLCSH